MPSYDTHHAIQKLNNIFLFDIINMELLPDQTVAFIAAFPQGIGTEVLFY